MPRRLQMTAADYVTIAVAPLLIGLVAFSLLAFLLQVFYAGQHPGRVQWVAFWFVVGAVCITRIAIEQGSEKAAAYGGIFALAMTLALWRFGEWRGGPLAAFGWLVGPLLMGLAWWCIHKLTWDSTLIDDSVDATGEGLLEAAGLAQDDADGDADDAADARSDAAAPRGRRATQRPAPGSASGPAESDVDADLATNPRGMPTLPWYLRDPGGGETSDLAIDEPKSSDAAGGERVPLWKQIVLNLGEREGRPHTPGVWALYFAIAAVPIFALGQLIEPRDGASSRFPFVVGVAVGLMGLLLATSFLGLRRYLRQRRLEMPAQMTLRWMLIGGVLVALLVLLAMFIPRPNPEYAWADLTSGLKQVQREASRWAPMRGDGTRDDRADRAQGPTDEERPASPDGRGEERGGSRGQSQGGESQPSQSDGSQAQPNEPANAEPAGGNSSSDRPPAGDSGSQAQQRESDSAGSRSQDDRNSSARQDQRSPPDQSPGEPPGGQQNQQQSPGSDPSGGDRSPQGEQQQQQQQQPDQQSPPPQQPQPGQQSSQPGQQGGQQQQQQQQQGRSPREREEPQRGTDQQGEPPRDVQSEQEQPEREEQSEPRNAQPAPQQPPSTPSSPARSVWEMIAQLWRTLVALLALLVKLAVHLAAIAVVLWVIYTYWRPLVAGLAQLWRDLLAWWQGRRRARPTAEATAAPPPRPRPFADFVDPFRSGAWQRQPAEELVRYTFDALQAWGYERELPRLRDETPLEFAARLAPAEQAVADVAPQLAGVYCHVQYARGRVSPAAIELLKECWQRMSAPQAVPARV